METIRFAPLIRVSTEKQKAKGESLTTQLSQITKYVELLKGTIPEHCLIYQGQEHATPNMERALLDRLLADSSKGLFDAVIVTDASRWSRDNLRSEAGLNTLAENGVRFFVGVMEYDLNNPEHRFILGMSTSINQLQATKQSINSINNRIERAKRNINSAGRLPFGRTFDKQTGTWGIDKDKKRLIEKAAERYLNGEGIPQIAQSFNMNPSNLHRIFTQKCGTIKTSNFKYKKINETISFTIPELLTPSTIEAIRQRIYINKTYTAGNKKHEYLLTGFIFCDRCGLMMKAHTNESKNQYYLHSKNGGRRCKFGKFLSAPQIENAVLLGLIQTFGDPELIERAIRKASPDMSKVEALLKEKININGERKKITSQKNIIIDKIADSLITDEDVRLKMGKLKDKEESSKQRLIIIESELSSTPDPEHIKKLSRWTGKVIASVTKGDSKLIFQRPFEWKRRLIERAFSGSSPTGQHLGVYIDLKDNIFTFEVKGLFESTVNSLPLSDNYLMEAFKLDPEYMDVDKELIDIRSNLLSEYIICSAG